METYVLWCGIALLVIGIITVLLKREVSTGQALVLAFGGALVALPQLVTFEWSQGTLKFTTKSEAVQITDQIKHLSQQQVQLGQNLVSLTEALGKVTTQVEAIQARLEQPASAPQTSLPAFDPADWQRLKLDSQRVIEDSSTTFRALETLQENLRVQQVQ